MSARVQSGGRQRLGRGVIQVLLADGLALPVGLVTAAYLGRVLGPHAYGVLSIALAIESMVEWIIVSLFSRATVQVVSESDDARRVAAAAFRLQSAFGLAAGAVCFAIAGPMAAAVDEPAMAAYLRLLAIEIPIVGAAAACRNVLTGRGQYRERALSNVARWIARLFFVVLLVHLGLSIYGALVGEILASLAWLAAGWAFARIPVTAPGLPGGSRRLWGFAVPLFVLALCMRVLDRIGLIALKILGASSSDAGWYAAAQNFGVAPALFALSFSHLLHSAIAGSIRGSDKSAGRPLVRNALRLVAGLLPFAAFGAGSTSEIVRLIYGPTFEPAAGLAVPLIVGALAMIVISISSSILAAAEQAVRASWLVTPVTGLGVGALWFVVPRYGAMGAAVVVAMSTIVCAALLLDAVRRSWDIGLPAATALRALVISVVTLAASLAWPVYGVWFVVKAVAFVAAIVVAFAALGEFDAGDIRYARSLLGVTPREEQAT